MNDFEQFLRSQVNSRSQQGILRQLKPAPIALRDFTSNDYLGLAQSPELQRSINAKLAELPHRNGATGSRLLSGNSNYHQDLEESLCKLFDADACLLFNSGYSANTGVLSCIATRRDTILYDERCHASIKDGIRLSAATKYPFKHNDLHDLERKCKLSKGKTFVVVESIYSMDGDISPLQDLTTLADTLGFFLVVDEAHSTGCYGKNGAGLLVELGLHNKVPIRIYTFGKAIGLHGACVAGSKPLVDFLVNFSRPFIYTTALPDHTVIALMEAFKHLHTNPALKENLAKKINLYRAGLFNIDGLSQTPIQTVVCGSIEKTKILAQNLHHEGFDVRPIFAPTVPQGSERIRICLHTFNSDSDINSLTSLITKNDKIFRHSD